MAQVAAPSMGGGYGEEVMQNSEAIENVAGELDADKLHFEGLIEQFYKLISDNIGETDTGNMAWFGPKASVFKANIDAKKPDFETAASNIQAVATNLHGHAETWNTFENGA